MKLLILSTLLFSVCITVSGQEVVLFKDCQQDTIDGQKIVTIAEVSPVYEGGMPEFYSVLVKDLKFKKTGDHMVGCQKIILTVIIDSKGNIRNFCSSQELEMDEDFLNKINNWKPGKSNNEPVPVRLMLPVYIKFG